jgi:hypothetical protein
MDFERIIVKTLMDLMASGYLKYHREFQPLFVQV